jgi:small subunit ribosomal protein S18
MARKIRRRGRKVCPFCANENLVIDYKDPKLLKQYTTERGKIIPRRITGICAKHQRQMALHIKRSRQLALMPFLAVE